MKDDQLICTIIFIAAKNKQICKQLIQHATHYATTHGFTHTGIQQHARVNKIQLLLRKMQFIKRIQHYLTKRSKDFTDLITELLQSKGQDLRVKMVPAFDSIKPLSEKKLAIKEWKQILTM